MSNAIQNETQVETQANEMAQPGVKQELSSGHSICVAASRKCFSLYGYAFRGPINLTHEAAQDLLQDLEQIVGFIQANLPQVMDMGARRAAKSLELDQEKAERAKTLRVQEMGAAVNEQEKLIKLITALKAAGAI